MTLSLADASRRTPCKLAKTKENLRTGRGRAHALYSVWNRERLQITTDSRKRWRSPSDFSNAPTMPHLAASFGFLLPNCWPSIARADVRQALPRIWRRK